MAPAYHRFARFCTCQPLAMRNSGPSAPAGRWEHLADDLPAAACISCRLFTRVDDVGALTYRCPNCKGKEACWEKVRRNRVIIRSSYQTGSAVAKGLVYEVEKSCNAYCCIAIGSEMRVRKPVPRVLSRSDRVATYDSERHAGSASSSSELPYLQWKPKKRRCILKREARIYGGWVYGHRGDNQCQPQSGKDRGGWFSSERHTVRIGSNLGVVSRGVHLFLLQVSPCTYIRGYRLADESTSVR